MHMPPTKQAVNFIGFCRHRGPNIEYKQVHIGTKAGFMFVCMEL